MTGVRRATKGSDDELQGNGFSVLAGLGVFGPEAQADGLADLKPTPITDDRRRYSDVTICFRGDDSEELAEAERSLLA